MSQRIIHDLTQFAKNLEEEQDDRHHRNECQKIIDRELRAIVKRMPVVVHGNRGNPRKFLDAYTHVHVNLDESIEVCTLTLGLTKERYAKYRNLIQSCRAILQDALEQKRLFVIVYLQYAWI